MANEYIPDRDASLGLIFRLNNLWAKVDYYAEKGLYSQWNNVLDRIYCNLQYRNPMVKVSDKLGNVVYKVPTKDSKVYKYFSLKISGVKRNHRFARTKLEKSRTKSRWYHALQEKDMWLRKFMQKLNLYMKETEQAPGSTMYGTYKRRYK